MQIEPGAESVLYLIVPVDLCGWLSKYVQLWDLELFTKILWAVKILGPTASNFPSIHSPYTNTFTIQLPQT